MASDSQPELRDEGETVPQPDDLGEPKARVKSWWIPVALIALVIIVILVAVTFIGDPEERAPDPPPSNGPVEATPPVPAGDAAAALPADGEMVTVKQRERRPLPGGPWKIELDDITGGQVLVEVVGESGDVVLPRRSLREGDELLLPTSATPVVRVKVERLVNFLTGEDFADLVVTPVTTAAPAMSEAKKIEALLPESSRCGTRPSSETAPNTPQRRRPSTFAASGTTSAAQRIPTPRPRGSLPTSRRNRA